MFGTKPYFFSPLKLTDDGMPSCLLLLNLIFFPLLFFEQKHCPNREKFHQL
jgi:hypothetical protein